MAKWIAGTTCAAAVLSLTLVSAQTTSPSSRAGTPAKPSSSQAAKAQQEATITGCVVRDAANGGQATIASNGISYRLTGRRDAELEKYLGKRVEVTGTLDSGSTGARATSGKTAELGASGAPKGQTAIAGQSDVTVTGTPRDNTVPTDAVPLATDKGTTADLTGRMQVKTLRLVSPSCL